MRLSHTFCFDGTQDQYDRIVAIAKEKDFSESDILYDALNEYLWNYKNQETTKTKTDLFKAYTDLFESYSGRLDLLEKTMKTLGDEVTRLVMNNMHYTYTNGNPVKAPQVFPDRPIGIG